MSNQYFTLVLGPSCCTDKLGQIVDSVGGSIVGYGDGGHRDLVTVQCEAKMLSLILLQIPDLHSI